MTKLNPDVFALDTLRGEYKRQLEICRARDEDITYHLAKLERLTADRDTARERADSLAATLTRLEKQQ